MQQHALAVVAIMVAGIADASSLSITPVVELYGTSGELRVGASVPNDYQPLQEVLIPGNAQYFSLSSPLVSEASLQGDGINAAGALAMSSADLDAAAYLDTATGDAVFSGNLRGAAAVISDAQCEEGCDPPRAASFADGIFNLTFRLLSTHYFSLSAAVDGEEFLDPYYWTAASFSLRDDSGVGPGLAGVTDGSTTLTGELGPGLYHLQVWFDIQVDVEAAVNSAMNQAVDGGARYRLALNPLVQPAIVPVPATAGLLGSALAALGWLRRRARMRFRSPPISSFSRTRRTALSGCGTAP